MVKRPSCHQRQGSPLDHLAQQALELTQRHRAHVLAAAQAHGYGSVADLLIPHYQHIGHFLELCLADFGIHTFLAVVDFDAEPAVEQACNYATPILQMPIGDGNDDYQQS
jgi:hypothetical protein